jgi:hypothetical protein
MAADLGATDPRVIDVISPRYLLFFIGLFPSVRHASHSLQTKRIKHARALGRRVFGLMLQEKTGHWSWDMPTEDEAKTTDRGGLSRSALMRRGWTHRMILDLLPDGPDRSVPNPVVPGGLPMQIFSLARIMAVEATEPFRAAMATKLARSKP